MENSPTYPYTGNPYRKYVKNAVETATPLMLIIMLYDEAIKMCALASQDMGINKESVHNKLIKAQKIVTELTVSLNMEAGGEVAENLKSIYIYLHMRLVEANIENNKTKVEEVMRILKDLREAWHIVNQQNRKSLLQQSQGGISIQT
ncbi:MAG: flagellar export chaperone FliS [bacterium]